MNEMNAHGWWIYKGTGEPNDGIKNLPGPPSWREFTGEVLPRLKQLETTGDVHMRRHIGHETYRAVFQASDEEIELVNAALYLRRPLLITGKPGCGKSSLAYAVAYELKLGTVLRWSITSRSTLADGLYRYDAIGRLQDASLKRSASGGPALKVSSPDIGQYLRLGPLGTALLPFEQPRVLLIDEIDKSDIDLPNDLLNIFEEGYFEIPELVRLSKETQQVPVMPDEGKDDSDRVPIKNGRVYCHAFPFVVLTSNGEREFPPAFLRRCLRLDMQFPNQEKLARIVEAHLGSNILEQKQTQQLIEDFLKLREKGDLATDQLLNAIFMTSSGVTLQDKEKLIKSVLRYLTEAV